jgi:hypothetical protein
MFEIKINKMKTGIKRTIDGYQVWFEIDNQTFHLDEHVEETEKDSLEVAQFFERMLKVAFEKLDIQRVTHQREQFSLKQLWIMAQKYNQSDFSKMITEVEKLNCG